MVWVKDISKSKLELCHDLFDNIKDAIFIMEGDFFIDCNKATLEMFGVSREQIIGQTPYRYSPEYQPDGRKSIEKAKEKITAVQQGLSQFFEWNHMRLDGTVFETEVSLNNVNIENSFYVLAIVRDISKRKSTERQIQEREETFRALMENSQDTIMRFDRQNRHLYVNPVVEKYTHIPAINFIGKTHEELGFPSKLCQLWVNTIQTVFQEKIIQRIEFQLPTGYWIDWMVVPEFTAGGEVSAVITSARDITERKKSEKLQEKLQEQLQQSIKMEAIGRLAGGIAHDFNNILTNIIGNIQLILLDLKPDDPIWVSVDEIQKAAESAAKLTKQLLLFSRKQHYEQNILDINTIITNLHQMISRIIGEDIHLMLKLEQTPYLVNCNAGQIEQILINLVVNARDAMPDGGNLTIQTANIQFTENFIKTHPKMVSDEYICLMIKDTGCGMSDEVKQHLFEPFFTTKPIGQGTGLGLATIYGIVSQIHGYIDVDSEVKKGTTFKIYFPREKHPPQILTNFPPSIDLPGGTEKILFVEDEKGVRDTVLTVLTRLGYQIVASSDGEDAIVKAEQNQYQFDLLITDLKLPGISGFRVSEILHANNPRIKILYTSGYLNNSISNDLIPHKGLYFLEKPFSPQTLAKKIRQILDHP